MPYNATVVPGELATITPTMLLDPVVLATLSVCSYILLKDSLLRDTKPLLGAAEHPDEEEFAADKSKTMVSRMISGKKRVLVIYGSETGTSKAYANRFVREVRAHLGVGCLLCDPSKEAIEDLDQLPDDCVLVIFAATFGEGEPPSNAQLLLQLLEDKGLTLSTGKSLGTLSYMIFGLGNRTYEFFNGAAIRFDEALTARGAKRLYRIGEGNDDGHLEGDYLAWIEEAVQSLGKHLGVSEQSQDRVPDFVVKPVPREHGQQVFERHVGLFNAPITTDQLFSSSSERQCLRAIFDISHAGLQYTPGDHLAIWPVNPEQHVTRLLRLLGLEDTPDTVLEICAIDPESVEVTVPQPTTYRTLISHYLDISGLVSRQLLSMINPFAPTPAASKALESMSNTQEAYDKLVVAHRYTLGDVLSIVAPGMKWTVPCDVLLSNLPRLAPRFYSISSSPAYSPGKVEATVVVTKYHPSADPSKWVYGLASNFVNSINLVKSGARLPSDFPVYKTSHTHVPIHIRKSKFRLPFSPRIPVIMIGPGTGVAPYRGFVQDRVALARKIGVAGWGQMRLYYGCRRREEDFLYADEWEAYGQELEGGFHLRTAFSRETKQKVYVQDLLLEDRETVSRLILEESACVYICGEAGSMAKGVERVLAEILGSAMGSADDGAKALKMLRERSRLSLDVW